MIKTRGLIKTGHQQSQAFQLTGVKLILKQLGIWELYQRLKMPSHLSGNANLQILSVVSIHFWHGGHIGMTERSRSMVRDGLLKQRVFIVIRIHFGRQDSSVSKEWSLSTTSPRKQEDLRSSQIPIRNTCKNTSKLIISKLLTTKMIGFCYADEINFKAKQLWLNAKLETWSFGTQGQSTVVLWAQELWITIEKSTSFPDCHLLFAWQIKIEPMSKFLKIEWNPFKKDLVVHIGLMSSMKTVWAMVN